MSPFKQLDINDFDHEKCLGDLDLKFGPNCHNNLLLSDLRGVPPRRVGSDDDDLSLGASASPTSSASKLWYDNSSTYDSSTDYTTRIKQETGKRLLITSSCKD